MKLPQKNYPSSFSHKANQPQSKAAALPFQLQRCGYCNDRHIEFETDYSNFVIFYLLDGIAHYTKHKDSFYINSGNIILSNCNTRLSFSRATPGWQYFYIVFNGTHAKYYYNMIRGAKGIIPISPLHNIHTYFTDLCALAPSSDVYTQLQECYLLHQILHELILVTTDIDNARLITPVQQTVVNTVLRYIDEHYTEDLSIDSICGQVGFSKYYFCKIFKERTGQTLYQYLNQYRVNKSKELLTYSKLSIHAVALEVGFKSTLTYSRNFKQYEKITPSEYREAF